MRHQLSLEQLKQLGHKYIVGLPQKEYEGYRIVSHFKRAFYEYLEMFKMEEQTNHKHQIELLKLSHQINQNLPEEYRYFESELDHCYKLKSEKFRCGAVVQRKHNGQNYYLIVKDTRTGREGFPKGGIEENQSKIECAIRETKQETGFDIDCDEESQIDFNSKGDLFGGIEYKRNFVFFRAKLKQEVPFEKVVVPVGQGYNEVTKHEWVTAKQLKKRTLNYPTSKAGKLFGLFNEAPADHGKKRKR